MIAPLYIYNIAMTIIAIGFVIGTLSIIIHHYVTKD